MCAVPSISPIDTATHLDELYCALLQRLLGALDHCRVIPLSVDREPEDVSNVVLGPEGIDRRGRDRNLGLGALSQ